MWAGEEQCGQDWDCVLSSRPTVCVKVTLVHSVYRLRLFDTRSRFVSPESHTFTHRRDKHTEKCVRNTVNIFHEL